MTIETRTEDRKALAKALAAELGTEARYMGVPSCAYQAGAYTVNRDGSISGEDFGPIRDFLARLGVLPEETEVAEREQSPAADPESGTESVTGMCVTIPLRDYTPQALVNLLRTVYARQKLLNAMTQSSLIRIDGELIDRLNDEKPETAEQIQKILKDEIEAGLVSGIGLEDGKLSVDFPYDESNPTAWTAFSGLIIAVADRAKTQRFAGASLLDPEDSEMKYFCRSWLIQLGFGGPEHKEARRVLLGHLHGFAAFRTADKMDAHKAKLAAKRGSRRREEIIPEVTVHDQD